MESENTTSGNKRVELLEQQLAAEREKSQELLGMATVAGQIDTIKQLRSQLAAEREKTEAWQRRAEGMKLGNENYQREIQQLNAALAGERERVRQAEASYPSLKVENLQLREQLAATERTLEAAYERWRIIEKRAHADHKRELNAKLAQINAQAKTIRELVEALEDAKRRLMRYDESTFAIDAALANLGTYPLPDAEDQWPDDSPAAKAPNSPLVENYLRLFTESILHGDDVHKKWLLEAVECFIRGEHIPAVRSQIFPPEGRTS